MEYLAHYLLFLGQALTIAITTLIIVAGIAAIASKGKAKQKGKISIKPLNKHFDEVRSTIDGVILDKKEQKALKKSKKDKPNKNALSKRKLFVIHFHGDIKASAVAALREEVTAVLLTAKQKDRVLVCLESGGGMVNAYGLAASQLQRLKSAKLHLTIAIDKVAASGGYMMACVADQIIAAPFAVVGSIGVVAQLPNFHRFLKEKNIDFEQLTAGEYKRTLTMFGENTKEGRSKMQEDINETQELFKKFIKANRSCVNIDEVATGEHWFATQAIELKLVDALQTSDDFILQQRNQYDLFNLKYEIKKSLSKKLAGGANALLYKFGSGVNQHGQDYI